MRGQCCDSEYLKWRSRRGRAFKNYCWKRIRMIKSDVLHYRCVQSACSCNSPSSLKEHTVIFPFLSCFLSFINARFWSNLKFQGLFYLSNCDCKNFIFVRVVLGHKGTVVGGFNAPWRCFPPPLHCDSSLQYLDTVTSFTIIVLLKHANKPLPTHTGRLRQSSAFWENGSD